LFLVDSAKKKFLSIQFLLLLEFAAYKKKFLFHYVIVQNISVASKTKKKEKSKKKIVQKKMFIGFCSRKLNKRKLDQINLELAQIWGQLDIVCFGFQIRV
jgi:hypothetical protein